MSSTKLLYCRLRFSLRCEECEELALWFRTDDFCAVTSGVNHRANDRDEGRVLSLSRFSDEKMVVR